MYSKEEHRNREIIIRKIVSMQSQWKELSKKMTIVDHPVLGHHLELQIGKVPE